MSVRRDGAEATRPFPAGASTISDRPRALPRAARDPRLPRGFPIDTTVGPTRPVAHDRQGDAHDGTPATACPYCQATTYEDIGQLTVTLDDRLIVIEDVPVRICKGCMEQFYGEDILMKIEQLRGAKFASSAPKRVVEVPVFAWEDL